MEGKVRPAQAAKKEKLKSFSRPIGVEKQMAVRSLQVIEIRFISCGDFFMRDDQKLQPVAKAFEAATGYRPHPTTLWRFYTAGSRGRILKTWKVGGRRMTSMAAVREFVDSTTVQSVTGTADALARELA